jgi:hypothetical protein
VISLRLALCVFFFALLFLLNCAILYMRVGFRTQKHFTLLFYCHTILDSINQLQCVTIIQIRTVHCTRGGQEIEGIL